MLAEADIPNEIEKVRDHYSVPKDETGVLIPWSGPKVSFPVKSQREVHHLHQYRYFDFYAGN
jgi:hypothetical protein